jgi:glyoxylate reductase
VKPSVYVSRRVPGAVIAELDRLFALTVFDEEHPPAREELLAGVAGRDGVCTMLSDLIDDELLGAAGPQLRVVANYAVGYDNVDVDACSGRGVVDANTPGVLTEATGGAHAGTAPRPRAARQRGRPHVRAARTGSGRRRSCSARA